MSIVINGPRELLALQGQQIGVSDWITIDQSMIDRFADATGDDYWGHVDPEASKRTPFGKTIAHGLLVLSLHPCLMYRMVTFEGFSQLFHYGYEKVRFPAPALVDTNVRMTAKMEKVEPQADGHRGSISFVFDSDTSTKPVCVAHYIQYFAN